MQGQFDFTKKQSFPKLIEELKDSSQDFEFYPTTDEQIEIIRQDLKKRGRDHFGSTKITDSILDCGAGDGRVLTALTEGNKYAIERSQVLLNQMPRDIFIVGTEFEQQTIIDKRVDVVVSNPIYSKYALWSEKLIREANAPLLYLIIPQRWQSNEGIADALKARKATTEILGEFDFLEADRKARAKVHVVRINLSAYEPGSRWRHREEQPTVDPFDLWFTTNFCLNLTEGKLSEFEQQERMKESVKASVQNSNELIADKGLVHTLETLYHRDLAHLVGNYRKVCDLDPDLLRELDVSINAVKGGLKLKIKSLKDTFWREFFANLETITNRLTSATRKRMLDKMMQHVALDFTASNAYAVALWAVKVGNHYYDDQLIETMQKMTEEANVVFYKSNEKTFGSEKWRYCRQPEDLARYKLDYRIVLQRTGGICTSEYSFENTRSGLTERAGEFIDDLRTVASNLGFDTRNFAGAQRYDWASNKKVEFWYRDTNGETLLLFEAKAFKNQNLHLKINQKLMLKLNVEYGRLMGWCKNWQEAAREMEIPETEAARYFGTNLKIEAADLPLMLTQQ